MKKYIYSIFFTSILATISSAQISIGGKQSVEGANTLLDFNSTAAGKLATDTTTDNTYGIILPAFSTDSLTAVGVDNNGTFYFDTKDKIAKMYENGNWVPLSDVGSTATMAVVNTSTESTGSQGVIIGANTSLAKGVLVLESANKAVILPRIITPHTTVKSPYPGMMCYDVTSKSLAVFDGSYWNYWK